MNTALLQQHWALAGASVLILAVALFIVLRLLQDSRRGRLARALGHLRERERALAAAEKALEQARSRHARLEARSASVPPGKLLEARDAIGAAEETARLLRDQVLVVRNTARTRILEDYPPAQHAAMLKKCLGETR